MMARINSVLLTLWCTWADCYAAAARDTWHSLKLGKGLGPGTLFKMAAENGWRNGGGNPCTSWISQPMPEHVQQARARKVVAV